MRLLASDWVNIGSLLDLSISHILIGINLVISFIAQMHSYIGSANRGVSNLWPQDTGSLHLFL